jgi:hypothetical protein
MTAREGPTHGWLDAPWAEPVKLTGGQMARSRGLYRKAFFIAGIVVIASGFLPWREHYQWIRVLQTFPAAPSHLHVSYSSTMGFAVPPWGVLVGLLGVAMVVVALRMVPDRRAVGITMTALATAALAGCVIAMIGFERQYADGLNAASAWGACGGTTAYTCFNVAGPWRDAFGAGVYLGAGASCVALVAGVLFSLSVRHLPATSTAVASPISGDT